MERAQELRVESWVGRNNFINLKVRRTLRKKGIYKRVTEKKKETMPDKEKKGKKR